MGYVDQSATAIGVATVTPTYTAAAERRLLIATITSHCTTPSTLSGATAGWALLPGAVSYPLAIEVCEIWAKISDAADVAGGNMPTWNFASGTQSAACISEWSDTTVMDQFGTVVGTVSPNTVTANAPDNGHGRVVVFCGALRQVSAGTTTITNNVNGQGVGTNVSVLGDTTAVNQASHQLSGYSVGSPTGTSADTEVMTSTTVTQHVGLVLVSLTTADAWGAIPID
jgi:hypothetical protein